MNIIFNYLNESSNKKEQDIQTYKQLLSKYDLVLDRKNLTQLSFHKNISGITVSFDILLGSCEVHVDKCKTLLGLESKFISLGYFNKSYGLSKLITNVFPSNISISDLDIEEYILPLVDYIEIEIKDILSYNSIYKTNKSPKVDTNPSSKVNITDDLNDLITYVKKVASLIDTDDDFTLTYMEEVEEIGKYKLPAPGIALICTDLNKSIRELKSHPITNTFNNSKTLKRYVDWKKDNIEDLGGRECWISIYINAKVARTKKIKSIKEDTHYIGYLSNNTIVRVPVIGAIAEYLNDYYIIDEVDGQYITLINEDKVIVVNESSILEILPKEYNRNISLYLKEGDDITLGNKSYRVISEYNGLVTLVDEDKRVYEYLSTELR